MSLKFENDFIRGVLHTPLRALQLLNSKLRNDKTISNYLHNKKYGTLSKIAKAVGYGKRKRKTKRKPRRR